MVYVCIYESTKRNMSKPRENTNQPPSFVVSAKSMFQLVSAGDNIHMRNIHKSSLGGDTHRVCDS